MGDNIDLFIIVKMKMKDYYMKILLKNGKLLWRNLIEKKENLGKKIKKKENKNFFFFCYLGIFFLLILNVFFILYNIIFILKVYLFIFTF